MSKSRMLDELAHGGPEHLGPDFVAGFDRKQGYPDWAADLAALCERGIGLASTAVALGPGPGNSRWRPRRAWAGWWRSTSRPPC